MLNRNIFEVEFEDYKIDSVFFNKILTHFTEFQAITKNNNIRFIVAGHLSLVLLSSKIYRTPKDMDIIIDIDDFKKWVNCLSSSWDWFGNLHYLDHLSRFLQKKAQIYGSNKAITCVNSELESTTYEINNGFKIYKESTKKNLITRSLEINDNYPEWAVHNPTMSDENKVDHIEIKNDLFKIIFSTNSVGQHFTSFVIFYDKNFKQKKIVECSFNFDKEFNNQKYAYWSTPFLKFEDYNNSFYKIFVHKCIYSTQLINKETKIILDIHVVENNESNFYTPNIEYNTPSQLKFYIKHQFNNELINLSYPYFSSIHKFGRKKDLDDMFIYKDLLDKYPLTNL